MTKQGDMRLHAGVALSFAILYFVLRSTPSFINMSAGLSLTLFLFASRRFWPALAIGQLLGASLAALDQFGQPPYNGMWIAAVVALPVIAAMAVAYLARQKREHLSFFGLSDSLRFLGIAAGASVAFGLVGLMILSTIAAHIEQIYPGWPRRFGLYALGTFIGSLSLAPAVAAMRDRLMASRSVVGALSGMEATFRRHLSASLQVGAYCGAAVALKPFVSSDEGLWILRCCLSLPLFAMVARVSPRPIAFALPCVMLTLSLTQGERLRDPQLLGLTAFVAFVGGIVLVWSLSREEDRAVNRHIRSKAQRYKQSAEARAHLPGFIRRQHAAQIDQMLRSMTVAANTLRDKDMDREEAAQLWWRTRHQLRALRDEAAPPILIGHGLRAALASNPVVEAVEDAGGTFHSAASANVRELSLTIQETAYHVATQAAYLLLSLGTPERMAIRVRAGTYTGRRWAVVTVKAHVALELDTSNGPQVRYTENAIKDLAKVAKAFGGTLHRRDFGARQTIAALVVDDTVESLLGIPMKRAGER